MTELLPITHQLDVLVNECQRRGLAVQFITWVHRRCRRELEFALSVKVGVIDLVCDGAVVRASTGADHNLTVADEATMYVGCPETLAAIVESVVKKANAYITKLNERENPPPQVFKLEAETMPAKEEGATR